jgi:hypothetical protein
MTMTTKSAREVLLDAIDANLRIAEKNLAAFASDLVKDHDHALAWGESAFRASATLSVFGHYRPLAADPARALESLSSELTTRIVREAASTGLSTSTLSNLLKRHTLAAESDLLELVTNIIKYGAVL